MTRAITTSIAMCTFNGAAFLEEQLASLAAQSRLPDELVVGDDGSHDSTLAILDRFAASAPFPVRVHSNPVTLGYRGNFVATAGRCRGELIFFCDQDDAWQRDKITRMSAAFADPSLLLAYHDAVLCDGTGREFGRLYDPAVQRAIVSQQPLPPWHFSLGLTQAFRRELLAYDALWPASRDHLTDNVMAHDQWYIFLAFALGRVAYLDAPLVRYRQHGGNVYGAQRPSAWRRFASRFSHTPAWDLLAEAAASARAATVVQIARDHPARRQHLEQIADAYRGLAERHSRRYRTFTAPGRAGRARLFAAAVARHDYAGKPWGLGRAALPRDLVAGVLGRRSRAA